MVLICSTCRCTCPQHCHNQPKLLTYATFLQTPIACPPCTTTTPYMDLHATQRELISLLAAGLPNTAPIVPPADDPPLLPASVMPAANILSPAEQGLLYLAGAVQRQTAARLQLVASAAPPASTTTFLATPTALPASISIQDVVAQLPSLGVSSLQNVGPFSSFHFIIITLFIQKHKTPARCMSLSNSDEPDAIMCMSHGVCAKARSEAVLHIVLC